MIDKSNILQYFPHDSFRSGQAETITQIIEYFDSGYKNVCLEMPTGGGKSAIAFTVSRFFGSEYCNFGNSDYYYTPIINHKAYIVTPQKILQDQYYNDIDRLILHEEMKVLKGKGNYPCILIEGNTCEECIISAGKKCPKKDICEYYRTETQTIESQTAVLNYHMLHVLDNKLYNRCFDNGLLKTDLDKYELQFKRDLMIVDEAHNTESFLMDLISVKINVLKDQDKLRFIDENITLEETKSLLTENINNLYDKIGELQTLMSSAATDTEAAKYGKKIVQIENKIKKLEYLEMTIENGNWVFDKDIRINEDENSFFNGTKYCHAIECKPIFVSNFASMLFRCSRLKLFISATLPDKEIFCRSLGLKEDETVYIQTPNNFPIENRKTYFMGSKQGFHTINQKNIKIHGNIVYQDLYNVITRIVNFDFLKDKKGLIITHSNKIMTDICSMMNLQFNRVMIPCSGSIEVDENDEIKDSRLNAINKHIQSKEPSILIGPNLYEGLDLKYDLCRFVIMVKCPYPFEDEQIKARRNVDYNWYYNNIAIKIVQGLGRGIRAADDWVMNYLIDPGFEQFIYGRGSKYIPNYIKQSMELMPKMFTEGD